MRVNIYAEEMTVPYPDHRQGDRRQAVHRPALLSSELPVNLTAAQHGIDTPVDANTHFARGPFLHHTGDDDSAAVTFWGKSDLRAMLRKALAMLDEHYAERERTAFARTYDANARRRGQYDEK